MYQKINRSLGLVLFSLCACFLTSCSWQSERKPPVLIIAVDHLSSDLVRCSQESQVRKGFSHLCNEGVRFTHAFTSSLLSLPALSSILTAQYPHKHGLRTNGSQYLSGQARTVTEVAASVGYHTSLFSGGPPLTKVSGLQQGFELFEDHFLSNLKTIYRNASQVIQLFTSWERENRDKPFFSLLYFPDLSFPLSETQNDLGEIRNLSFESQVDEIDESLGNLFAYMKKEKIWDSTYVILVGLHGRPSIKNEEPLFQPLDLTSSNSQVTLLIKPPFKPRDQGLNWSQDQNVSLVDVGQTLFDILEKSASSTDDFGYSSQSLSQSLKSPQGNLPTDRLILTETAWGKWRLNTPIQYAIRSDQYLYTWTGQESVFNSLIDRSESIPLQQTDSSIQFFLKSARNSVDKLVDNLKNTKTVHTDQLATTLNANIWLKNDDDEDSIQQLKRLSNQEAHLPAHQWIMRLLIRNSRFSEVETYGKKMNDPFWIDYSHLAKVPYEDPQKIADPCLKLIRLKIYSGHLVRLCNQPKLIALAEWLATTTDSANPPDHLRKNLILNFYEDLIEQNIDEANLSHGITWNVPIGLVESKSRYIAVLSLPQFQKHRNWLQKEVSTLKVKTE